MLKILPYCFAFLSAATSLSLQILWQERLWWHLGTLQSTSSLIIAVFFLGLGMGSLLVIPQKVSKFISRKPWTAYAFIEIFVLLWSLFLWFALSPSGALEHLQLSQVGSVKVFAAVLIFPPTIAMGATLPVLAKFARADLLYTLQLAGAVAGSWLTGFVSLPEHGFAWSYGLTLMVACVIALSAGLGVLIVKKRSGDSVIHAQRLHTGTLSSLLIAASICGFSFLAMEMIWIRLLALVHHNSAYAFQMTLLSLFLAMLGGSLLVNLLNRLKIALSPGWVLTLCGILCAWYLPWFLSYSDGFIPWGAQDAESYRSMLFIKGLLAVAPLALPMSVVFPMLIPSSTQNIQSAPSPAVPHVFALLLGFNTLFGTLAALLTTAALIPLAGMYVTVQWIALLLTASGLIWIWKHSGVKTNMSKRSFRFQTKIKILITILVFAAFVIQSLRFPMPESGFLRADHTQRQAKLLEQKESSEAVFHVLEKHSQRLLLVNNQYSVGGTAGINTEHFLGQFPMQLYRGRNRKKAQHVYVLGMGTGITAAAIADQHPEKLVVTELYADLIDVSRKWFEPWNKPLFTTPGIEIHAADGRAYLQTTSQKFDLILGELFIPWKSGVDRLYSLEHFEVVKQKLNADGAYVQWLPLWQMGPESFKIIVRTMRQVFPSLTIWVAGNNPAEMSAALVAFEGTDSKPLGFASFSTNSSPGSSLDAQTSNSHPLFHFAGSIPPDMQARCPEIYEALFPDSLELNTMDNRLLQYAAHNEQLTVLTASKHTQKSKTTMSGQNFLDFNTRLFQCTPPDEDPLLKKDALVSASVNRGYFFRQYLFFKQQEMLPQAQQALNRMKIFGTPNVSPSKDSLPAGSREKFEN